MKPNKVEQALKLLEQAKALLHNHPNDNIKKSEAYLQESIRRLKEHH